MTPRGGTVPRNLTGHRFGRLCVTGYVRGPDRRLLAIARCDCGETWRGTQFHLTREVSPTRSCGCLRSEMRRAANYAAGSDPRSTIGSIGTADHSAAIPVSIHPLTSALDVAE